MKKIMTGKCPKNSKVKFLIKENKKILDLRMEQNYSVKL